MSLTTLAPVAFLPTNNSDAARHFYQETLSLPLLQDDGFALVFRLGPPPGIMLRIARVGPFTPAPFTILGWEADDLDATIDQLRARNVAFLRFPGLEQDPRGIWTAPGGDRIAWFQDPDGNTLSLSAHRPR